MSVYFDVLSFHVFSCKNWLIPCTGINPCCMLSKCRALFHTPKRLLILVEFNSLILVIKCKTLNVISLILKTWKYKIVGHDIGDLFGIYYWLDVYH